MFRVANSTLRATQEGLKANLVVADKKPMKTFKAILQMTGSCLGLFVLLALPALLMGPKTENKLVAVKYPSATRSVASVSQGELRVPTKSCQTKERWRYRCDKNKKNCVKENLEYYLRCKPINKNQKSGSL